MPKCERYHSRVPSSRSALVERLAGKDSGLSPVDRETEALRTKLARAQITAPAGVDEDVVFAGAVQAVPTTVKPKDPDSIRKILLNCLDRGLERTAKVRLCGTTLAAGIAVHFVGVIAETTNYVALPFVFSDEGVAAECFSGNAAVILAQALSRKPGHAGAIAFSRTGDHPAPTSATPS